MRRISHLEELAPLFQPGRQIVLHSACAAPPLLSAQLLELPGPLAVFDLVTIGQPAFLAGVTSGALRLTTVVPGRAVRRALRAGQVEFIRCPLSQAPALFASGRVGADILLLHLSPPDADGTLSLGISCDVMHAVLARKPTVIAEISPAMPRTRGQTTIRPDQVDYWLEGNAGPVTVAPSAGDATDAAIADHIAGLIRDGDVLQTGIGSIPDLTVSRLGHLTRLGVHTGILTEAVQPLIERGAIAGPAVTTVAAGSADFYRFLHENDAVAILPCDQTHGAETLASIRQLCAVNGALEIDLCGRINAEAVDGQRISGPGGQSDFATGATAAPGGKSIIALRATSKDGSKTRIVPQLAADAPVTIDTSLVDYVVTEYGIARVTGLSGTALAHALAGIAAPDFRADLLRA